MNKSAIICPIKNEKVYISKFLDYYSAHFESKDIYILNFGSDREYLDEYIGDRAQVLNTHVDILDAPGTFNEIKKYIKILRANGYDFVLPLDVDEIIFYDGVGGLKKYLRELDQEFVTCRGYEVIHIPTLQDDFDYSRGWFEQLEYWYADPHNYNKTVITKYDIEWAIGFHYFTVNGRFTDNVDDKLFLIHLHKHDYNHTIDKHLKAASLDWHENTVRAGHNRHYRNKNPKEVKQWYFESILKNKIYKIPEKIKKIIAI